MSQYPTVSVNIASPVTSLGPELATPLKAITSPLKALYAIGYRLEKMTVENGEQLVLLFVHSSELSEQARARYRRVEEVVRRVRRIASEFKELKKLARSTP